MRNFFAAFLAVLTLSIIPSTRAASPAVPEEKPAPEAKEKLPPPPPDEVLAKITAPAVRPVIKTKAGYSVKWTSRSKSSASILPRRIFGFRQC